MPTGRNVHIDTPLSNVLVASFETAGDFVAQRLFPVVPVGNQSDKYYILRKEAWLALPDTYRAPKTKARKVEFDTSSDSYYAKNHALGADIPLEDLANADNAIRLRDSNTALIGTGLLRGLEDRVASTATTSGNHVAAPVRNDSGSNSWMSVKSADLIDQIMTGHIAINNATGLRANVLLMDYRSYQYAKANQLLFSRFQYRATGNALVTDAQMMEAFQVDQLWVARSQKNVNPHAAVGSYRSIWGATAILAHVEPALSMQTMTWGLSFRWTSPELGVPMAVSRQVEDGAGSRHIEVLEGGYYQDEKLIAKDLAYYINTHSGTPW